VSCSVKHKSNPRVFSPTCCHVDESVEKSQTDFRLHPSQTFFVNKSDNFKALKYTLIGGFAFWAPSVLLHWLRGPSFSSSDIYVLTVLLPITTFLLFAIVRNLLGRFKNPVWEVLFPILGIWLLGPLMMISSASFTGGGFSTSASWRLVLLGTSLFPVFTVIMSTYDGTLGAVFATALLLPFLLFLPGSREAASRS
jgi:hypothetical protein